MMLRLLWLSLLVVVLDQLSKYWVVVSFEEYEVLRVWPVFNLTLVYNTGAAFSFLSDAGGWQRWFFIIVGVGVSMIMGIWLGVGGNNMLLYLAGLSNIPVELYESADIDGAGLWARFRHITWPQLAPTTFFIDRDGIIKAKVIGSFPNKAAIDSRLDEIIS